MTDTAADTFDPGPYPRPVWARFMAPAYAAPEGQGADLVLEATTPAAALRLQLHVEKAGVRIGRCRFRAYGCPFTIAVGDWLAQWCEGRSVAEVAEFSADQLREALEIPDSRAHCGLMAQDLLRDLMVELS